MKDTTISRRAASYGFRGETVDGNDVLAVYQAARQAVADCRSGQGPVLLELLTYRRTGHSRRDTSAYQPKEERENWFSRDPLDRFAAVLLERGDVSQADLDQIKSGVDKEINEAVEIAKQAPLPVAEEVLQDVFTPLT
jgi:TPP-dependent pyruvate/acetoin dehydrogenase alpha subunit